MDLSRYYTLERDDEARSTLPVRVRPEPIPQKLEYDPLLGPEQFGKGIGMGPTQNVVEVWIGARWVPAREYQVRTILNFDEEVDELRNAKKLLIDAGNKIPFEFVRKNYEPIPTIKFAVLDIETHPTGGGGAVAEIAGTFVDGC